MIENVIEQMFEAEPSELVSEIECCHREESKLMARRMAAIAGLLWHRTIEAEGIDPDPGWSMITGFARTAAEVGAAMNMAPMLARTLVAQAEALDERLPKIAALLAEARVDWRSVQLIITRTELVAGELIGQVDERLAERISRWQCWSRRRLTTTVDNVVRLVDPEAAKERRATADAQRYINVTAQPDGTAQLRGRLTATAAAAFDRRLAQMAKSVCAKDSRTMDQRRADALMALTAGGVLTCDCGQPDCPARGTEQPASDGGVRVVVNVIAAEATVSGESDQPGYLEGFGVIDADVVREMAEDAALRLLDEPAVEPEQALSYQPSAALARWIRCRDMTCRYPGCDRPAAFCDIDHTTPFNHANPAAGGLTEPSGLANYCREHHRLKTFHSGPGGWSDEQLADGTIVWTSPTGRTYHTRPDGPELFPQMRPACAEPRPRPRNHAQEKAARIKSLRRQLRAQRPVNAAQRQLDRARRREIDLRKWRNNSRKLLFILKGTPSTSPFARWINDPMEAEELEPGWRPPPEPSCLDCDDPPF
jgi:Domain of unknown function (DUF222)